MISATVEAHGEPLTSKTCDTNHLWPCELKASGNETGTTLFKRLRLSLESPGTENTAAHCMGIRKKKSANSGEALLARRADKTTTVLPFVTAQRTECCLTHTLTFEFSSS